jgi:DNA modification methylase
MSVQLHSDDTSCGDPYRDFLTAKFRFDSECGFEVLESAIHPYHKPHVRDLVRWALKKGRAAFFARFGLHKTMMQLEVMRHIASREGGRQLIVLPLGVRQEFRRDAATIGMDFSFVRSATQIGGPGLYLTNYESVRDGKVNVDLFNAVSLDEASVLRSFGSKTYQEFLGMFRDTPYRFVATATPSPNRFKELIHYAGFLGVMDTGHALTRFFQRNSEKANDLTLYPHMADEFFLWLHSWAAFLQAPSDLGYADDGYALPPLTVRWHELPLADLTGGVETNGQGLLFRDAANGLREAAAAKRDSIVTRVAKAAEIVSAAPMEHFILWHDLEAERAALKAALPDMVEVFGSLDLDEREQRIVDFSDGRFRLLGTKPILSGSGCNFQRHCHRAVFVGIGFKFNDFIQAIHRIQRYGQEHPVEIDIIYTEAERGEREILERKWSEHDTLAKRMSEIIQRYGLSTVGLEQEIGRSIGLPRHAESGERWEMVHNDTVSETRSMPDNSVDLVLSSIPFGTQYEYCESYNDFGHNADNTAFWRQMDFLTPQLHRVLKPGRVAAIHVKDRILFGNVTGTGMPTVDPFHAECIFHFRRHGFEFCGMAVILTDVVRENNQTYRLGWTEQCKDGSKMGWGCPEYLMSFRKLPSDRSRSYADEPVVKSKTEYSRARWQIDAHDLWRSSGDRLLTFDELRQLGPDKLAGAFPNWSAAHVYDHERHVAIGEALERSNRLPSSFGAILAGSWHPDIWHDVNRMRTLNSDQSLAGREKHVCPLQLDIVDRAIRRFSNPGDLVFDPFAGIGTIPVRAVVMGRRGHGVELHAGYVRDAIRYLRAAETEASTPTLFGLLAVDDGQQVMAEAAE